MEPQLDALAAIYRTHRIALRKKLLRHGVRFVDVDDVLHDLFSSLQRGFKTEAAMPDNLVGWVYAAAYNKAVDYLKQARLQLERYLPLDMDTLPPHATAPSPDAAEKLAAEERQRFLYAALERMAPELRVVFEHRVLYGLTSEQTAEILDLAETTVLSRYKASLAFLEGEYARWGARQSRSGALAARFGFGLAALLEHESARLDGGASDTPDGGWTRFLAHTGMSTRASLAGAQIASWRAKGRSVATFISGGIVGAAALWLFLTHPGSLAPPPGTPGEESSWSPSSKDSSGSPSGGGALSRDHLQDEATAQATLPEAPSASAARPPLPSEAAPSTVTREPHLRMNEQDLLAAAHRAVREARFVDARKLLARHAKEFPDGSLRSARDSLLAGLPR